MSQSKSYEYTYQPPIIEFLKHRYVTNKNLMVEAVLYATTLGLITYIILNIVSYQSIFCSLLFVLFLYLLFTTKSNSVKTFANKLKYVSTTINTSNM